MSPFTDLRDAIVSKAKDIRSKITSLKPRILSGIPIDISVQADIDAAIKVILDDSFLKVIDRAIFALDATISKTSQELQALAQKIFDNLVALEKRIETLVENFFTNLTALIINIKKNLVDPIVDAVFQLEEKFFDDLNQVLDKLFNFFTGTVKEFKDDLLRVFSPLPNPFDPCRQQLGLPLTPTLRLTHIDLFNLFECNQTRRLNNNNTIVKDIQEIYAVLQLESFKLTCLGRGSPAFQELYMRKWLKYGLLFQTWQEFNEAMTPQEAFDEAIRRLNEARNEYNVKAADIDRAQATASEALALANKAQATANDGVSKAENAQNTANNGVNKADNAQNTANNANNIASQVADRTQKIRLDGPNTVVDAGEKFFAIQADGNLVVYRKSNGQPIWSSGTN